jgi:predicted transcriptional regulator
MNESMPDLGNLEREVMQLIWANRRLTAETVREKLARRLKESMVRTVLRRLEEKGYVAHSVISVMAKQPQDQYLDEKVSTTELMRCTMQRTPFRSPVQYCRV